MPGVAEEFRETTRQAHDVRLDQALAERWCCDSHSERAARWKSCEPLT
jgi:hypothetical protein